MPFTSTSASISASSSSVRQSGRIERAGHEVRGEVAEIFDLALRQPASAQDRAIRRGDALGRKVRRPARLARRGRGGQHALPDRGRGGDGDLLADDRPRQCRERVAAAHEMDVRMGANQAAQHAVAPAERARRLVPEFGLGRGHARASRQGKGSGWRGARTNGAPLRPSGQLPGESAGLRPSGNGTLRGFLFPGIGMHVARLPAGIFGRRRRRVRRRARGATVFVPEGDRRRRSRQGAARRVRGRGNRLRSGQGDRRLLEPDHRRRVRAAADLRLPRAAGEARAEGGRGAAGSVAEDAKTYMFRLRKGIYFTPDPAFKGARRELVAQDVAYSIKRLVDPANRSPWRFLVDGKIVGLDARGEERGQDATNSTTTPRSPASRSSTSTRCASGSPRPTSTSRTSWRCRRCRSSPAK